MSGYVSAVAFILVVVGTACTVSGSQRAPAGGDRQPALRVCADPNNLPFSNDRGEGFENRIASMLASDLRRPVEYTWWAERRGFVRNTLNARVCDVILGVPAHFELAMTTRPYYRSSYVFVSQRSRHLGLQSLDDPRLRRLRIGVQLIGDDFANTPPAHALSARGLVSNVVGYSVYGNYAEPNPPARIVDAVARGDVDAAVAWGPLAGYFATREPVALEIQPVSPQSDSPFLPFVFDITMAVRRGETAWRDILDAFLERRAGDIRKVLDEYGVPRVGSPAAVEAP
jgi:quinoprotein dehydrogenase-associated probable ABC transporter substrate-binding protein